MMMMMMMMMMMTAAATEDHREEEGREIAEIMTMADPGYHGGKLRESMCLHHEAGQLEDGTHHERHQCFSRP